MPGPKIEDIRFSSSSVDDFFQEGKFRQAVATTGRVRVASLHQLAGFQLLAEDRLVHLSQKDFWKLGQDDEGFFIERLVDDDSGPVKG
jgi:hypothetical protein